MPTDAPRDAADERARVVAGETFAPCPFCHQYSHSIGEDQLADAFNHFQAMVCENPMKSWPTGYAFPDETRDAAQVLMAAARTHLADHLATGAPK